MSEFRDWIKVLLISLAAALSWDQVAAAAPSMAQSETASQIRSLFDRIDQALEAEDLDRLQSMIHPQSPFAGRLRKRLNEILADRDIDEEMIGYHFLAEDDPYAFVRAQVKWTARGGENFRDNITDTLYIFKKDGDRWKLWGELPLGFVLLD